MLDGEAAPVLDFASLRRALVSGWALIVVALLVGLTGSALYGSTRQPRYTAESQIYLSVVGTSSVQDLTQGADYARQLLQSYGAIASSPLVLDAVTEKLGLDDGALASAVTADPVTETSVLDIQVVWSSPTRAAAIANAVSDRLGAISDEVSTSGKKASPVELVQIAKAQAPVASSSPNVPLIVLVGALAGLLVGVLAALARDATSRRIRDRAEYAGLVPAPLLGETLTHSRQRGRALSLWLGAANVDTDRYRSIRTNLRYLSADRPLRTLLVTSALPSEGKTTLAVNLAIAVAQAGRQVVLVDADLRRPGVAATFGLDHGLGLSDALSSDVPVESMLQQIGLNENLRILPAGRLPPNPSELLSSQRMARLMHELEGVADLVIVDSPPVLPVPDASVLAPTVDAVLLIAAARRSHRSAHRRAFETLKAIGAPQIALVLTMVTRREAQAYTASDAS